MIIRGASGFGDAIYLYPIIKYYINKGEKVIVKTGYPEIFNNLDCECLPFCPAEPFDIDCNYVSRKIIPDTNQFEDTCILAGIKEKIEFKIDFDLKISAVNSKKTCIIQKPYFPMNENKKRFELMPDYRIMQKLINDYKDRFNFIQVGKTGKYENELYEINNVNKDLINKPSRMELLKLINGSDMFITQIGWGIAAAEALNKKVFVLFADKGLKCSQPFFYTITPKKVITKKTSHYCIDNESYNDIKRKFENAINQ